MAGKTLLVDPASWNSLTNEVRVCSISPKWGRPISLERDLHKISLGKWKCSSCPLCFLFRIQGPYSSDPHHMRQWPTNSKMRLSLNTGVPKPWAMDPSEPGHVSGWLANAGAQLNFHRWWAGSTLLSPPTRPPLASLRLRETAITIWPVMSFLLRFNPWICHYREWGGCYRYVCIRSRQALLMSKVSSWSHWRWILWEHFLCFLFNASVSPPNQLAS